MSTKRNYLEIVYNLQWKNKPTNTGDKSNVVGIYDIPATTLNWDTFKSYLLKNSGTTGDDVKVSYINLDKQEIAINSQMDFQIALYSIRQQARLGDIITLILDRVSDEKKGARPKKLKYSSDVQTQVDENDGSKETEFDQPPEWFFNYMNKFKKEIVEDVTAQLKASQQSNLQLSRKSMFKRGRKTSVLSADLNADNKCLKKTLKLEGKLENKLEKLEHKTLKIKAKKLALARSSDSDVGRSHSNSRHITTDDEFLMDARPTNQMNATVPHMNGGETYRHCWEVLNSGQLPWNAKTELRYAWGSQALMPVEKKVPCPKLSPGEKGIVSVFLNVPETPGSYECYWHFHHKGRRFGHWLGCHIIVDESTVKNHKYDIINIGENYELLLPTSWTKCLKKEEKHTKNCDFSKENEKSSLIINTETIDPHFNLQSDNDGTKSADNNKNIDIAEDVTARLVDLKLNESKTYGNNCGSDSDNQSIDSNTTVSSSDQFVVVAMPQNANKEIMNANENHNIHVQCSDTSDVVLTTDSNESKSGLLAVDSCEELRTKEDDFITDSDYAYIYYDGKKIPMLKKYLRPDYLTNAVDAPAPVKTQNSTQSQTESCDPIEQKNNSCPEFETNNSTQSDDKQAEMSNSMNNDTNRRLFVFPQHCPGFEVVYPSTDLDRNESWNCNRGSYDSSLQYSNCNLSKSGYDLRPTGTYFSHNNSMSALYEPTMYNYQSDFQSCGEHNCGDFNPSTTRVASPCSCRNATTEYHCQCDRLQQHSPQCAQVTKPYDKVLTGAAILASTAMSTARNVLNMVSRKEVGRWENGRWISTNPSSKREIALRTLEEMGFWDRNLNATLLARYEDDVSRVVADILQTT